LYYDFLIDLIKTHCKHIIITGGNHDAPGTLNAPKELLNALSIRVVGKATEEVANEVFELCVDDEKIIVAAVPYLRDQDIRRAVAGESFDQIGDRYKTALVNHYTEIANHCKNINSKNVPIIAMGHLFVIGGSTSESEQTIYVGNLGDIRAGDFPNDFDYVALGHLHRYQKTGSTENIRYSGSPYMLSFSESGYSKKVVIIETEANQIKEIREAGIPKFREILKVRGCIEECIAKLKLIDLEPHELTPWVEVLLDNASNTRLGFSEISKAAEALDLEVLKVSLQNEREIAGLEQQINNTRHIKELSPLEVFKLKCTEQEFNLDKRPEILDAFNEVFQKVKESD